MSVLAQLAVVVSLSLPGSSPPPALPMAAPGTSAAAETIAVPRAMQERRDRDRWFGDDKFRHFFMSFATTAFAFGGASLVGLDRDVAMPLAVGASAAAGLGKEFHDRSLGRPFSLRDLVWDAAGTGAGVALLRSVR